MICPVLLLRRHAVFFVSEVFRTAVPIGSIDRLCGIGFLRRDRTCRFVGSCVGGCGECVRSVWVCSVCLLLLLLRLLLLPHDLETDPHFRFRKKRHDL